MPGIPESSSLNSEASKAQLFIFQASVTKPDAARHLTIAKACPKQRFQWGSFETLSLLLEKKIHSPKRKINRRKDNILWLGVETVLQVCLFRRAPPSALEALGADTRLSRETKWLAQPTEECPVPEWSLLVPVYRT